MEMAKHLFFNLSLLLVLLFFIQMSTERKMTYKQPYTIFYIYGIVAILLCIFFSMFHQVVRFDLRLIPFIIGGLYLGTGFLFAIITIIVRAIIGIDTGFWVSCVLSLSTATLLLLAKPYFLKLSSKNRISIAVVYSIISSMIFLVIVFMIDPVEYGMEIWIPYFVISALGTGIIAYSLESMHINMKMREQLMKTKKIEAVSQMGAAISHEIRNPLTSARGFMQFLNEGKNLDQSQRDYIGIAISELDHAEEVISNYLTFAKPSIEKVEELDVHRILAQVLNELSIMIGTNNVEIVKKFYSSGDITGDRQMVQRCLYNLVKNCIESMPASGVLTFETEDKKNSTSIKISDTGFGMTDEQVNRLGEPFYLINEGNGTGLGMMVVHSIVRAMNGSIEIKSKQNEGSQFILTFPKSERTRQIV